MRAQTDTYYSYHIIRRIINIAAQQAHRITSSFHYFLHAFRSDLWRSVDPERQLWGSAAGGDTDELRLKSAPAVDGGNATVINLRGHGGNIDILHTKVKFFVFGVPIAAG